MKKLKILSILAILSLVVGCGEYARNDIYDKTYDMWNYIVPDKSMDIEYDVYLNGKRTDYFYETNKLFPSGVVERVSGEDRTVLTPHRDEITIKEADGEIVSVQRYIKIKDINIFQSPSIKMCRADDYFISIKIRGREFYEVIKVNCINKSGSNIDIYYGRYEGIVSIYKEKNSTISEIVKVKDVPLQ
jgi:hypothetical protein